MFSSPLKTLLILSLKKSLPLSALILVSPPNCALNSFKASCCSLDSVFSMISLARLVLPVKKFLVNWKGMLISANFKGAFTSGLTTLPAPSMIVSVAKDKAPSLNACLMISSALFSRSNARLVIIASVAPPVAAPRLAPAIAPVTNPNAPTFLPTLAPAIAPVTLPAMENLLFRRLCVKLSIKPSLIL
ncbi:hypothetical protein [Helicobacter phage COL 23-PUJ]|nr:hypothetical protein [Helicobacter phage COL 23-PUJ]